MSTAPSISLIDQILPLYDANEVHDRLLPADAADVWAALHATPMSEVRLAGVLMGFRSLPKRLTGAQPARRGADVPALEALTRAGFVPLGEVPLREVAVGAAGRFWKLAGNTPVRFNSRVEFMQFTQPGHARAVMNFRLVPEVGGTRLITETRILGTDPAASRAFKRYWLLIRLGSGAIRRSWLAAVARRLEARRARPAA